MGQWAEYHRIHGVVVSRYPLPAATRWGLGWSGVGKLAREGQPSATAEKKHQLYWSLILRKLGLGPQGGVALSLSAGGGHCP